MKIAIVTPHDYFHQGGVQEHVKAQSEGLRKLGHEVFIISPRVKKTEPENLPDDIILLGQAAKMTNPISLSTSTDFGFAVETKEIDEMFAKHKFDIVHFHEPWVPIISRQILNRSDAVNVATFHAKFPENIVIKSVETLTYPILVTSLKYIDKITAVSDAACDHFRSVSDREIEIVPNGIDLKKFSENKLGSSSNVSNDKKTILYVGRLEKRKGLQHLLKAFAEIENTGEYELIVAGDGPKRKSLEYLAKSLGLKNIKFLGFVSEEEKLKLLNSADLFCSPAIYGESFGVVLLEAMATKLPIVAGDNPGYRCVMKGVSKLGLVNPAETAIFSERLKLLLDEPELSKVLVNHQKEEVKKYDFDIINKRYEEIYKQLLKDNGSDKSE